MIANFQLAASDRYFVITFTDDATKAWKISQQKTDCFSRRTDGCLEATLAQVLG